MKILILGGDGMLGHQLFGMLGQRYEVKVTLRRELAAYGGFGLFSQSNAFAGVDVRDPGRLPAVLAEFRPQSVVNAVGLVKQRPDGLDLIANLEINALFPHRLAQMCRGIGARLVHVSTDGVFSGERGNYREEDRADAADTYGRCKLLGEVGSAGEITLRTAVIGIGLSRRSGLIDWFLQQRGRVPGYRNAVFSGLTAKELSRVIERILRDFPDASGLYHVSAAAISKHDLLLKLRDRLSLPIEVAADDSVRIDRSLDSSRFRSEFSYAPPSWDEMLEELAGDIRARYV